MQIGAEVAQPHCIDVYVQNLRALSPTWYGRDFFITNYLPVVIGAPLAPRRHTATPLDTPLHADLDETQLTHAAP